MWFLGDAGNLFKMFPSLHGQQFHLVFNFLSFFSCCFKLRKSLESKITSQFICSKILQEKNIKLK